MAVNEALAGQVAARYVPVFGGRAFRIDPSSGLSDRHIQGIHAPGLISGPNVLFFRTHHHNGRPTLRVRFGASQQPLIQYPFPDMVPVDWQTIIPAGMLLTQNNELIFSISRNGLIDIGDIFILYTCSHLASQPTVHLWWIIPETYVQGVPNDQGRILHNDKSMRWGFSLLHDRSRFLHLIFR